MPKQSPVPSEVDKPFYDAASDEKLVIQFCGGCQRWQFPPQPGCSRCGSTEPMQWREIAGRGTIYSYGVVYDSPIAVRLVFEVTPATGQKVPEWQVV